MTEQIEAAFWAEARAEDAAARGRQADPSACGTCRDRVAADRQVEHDECAQRATLVPAPDAPGYELLTGLSEEELAALPPRFHVPAYMESSIPQLWVCAVCWGDGWVTQWPCKTAVKNGLRVFTPEHEAETAAKRQTATLAMAQAQAADAQARIAELEGELAAAKDRHKAGLRRADEHLREMNAELQRYATGTEAPVLWSVYNKMHRRAATAEAIIAKLHTQPDTAPALPWAHLMPDDDLHGFLNDLVSAAIDRWRSDPDVPDREILANVEKVCTNWRTPGQGYRSDEPATEGSEPK